MHSGFAYRIGVNCIVVSLLLGNSQDLQYGYNEYMRFALLFYSYPNNILFLSESQREIKLLLI